MIVKKVSCHFMNNNFEYRKTFRTKYEVIKRILQLDSRTNSDYLMCWTKKNLIHYYNDLLYRLERKRENGK